MKKVKYQVMLPSKSTSRKIVYSRTKTMYTRCKKAKDIVKEIFQRHPNRVIKYRGRTYKPVVQKTVELPRSVRKRYGQKFFKTNYFKLAD